MGPLTAALALPIVVIGSPVAADPVARWQAEIAEASARFDVPEAWIAGVMRAESGGRTMLGGRAIRSPKGAIGLMQLMPGTWADMRIRLGLGTDPDDPRDNILAGTCYLRLMYDRFGYPGLFGAYNAGPARYAAWLDGRARLPAETVAYLAKLGASAGGAGMRQDVAGDDAVARRAQAPLFLVLREPRDGRVAAEAGDASGRPAASLSDATQPSLFAISKPRP